MTNVVIDPKKTYRTRDGRKVRIYAVDGGINRDEVHGAIRDLSGVWSSYTWYPHGGYLSGLGHHDRGLIEVKPRIKREVWVNVYEDYQFLTCHHDKGAANWNAKPNRIACVKLTIDCEEGEGL